MSFNSYRKRLERDGVSDSDAIKNQTVSMMNKNFKDSPSYSLIKHNGAEVDARVIEGKYGYQRYVIFRPYTKMHVGDYIEYQGRNWLIFDTFEETVSPKALITSCNEELKWKDVEGNVITVPVYALATKNTRYDIETDRWDVNLLAGMIYVIAKSTEETRTIKHSMRFIVGHDTIYEVAGVDDVTYMRHGGYGMIQFTLKVTTKVDGDDLVERIADNTYFYGSTLPVEDNEKGDSDSIW